MNQTLEFLEEEELDYQAVALPGGVSTPGHDRSYLNPVLFGSDFHGRSFLDIGSYLGYYCIEALRRGAQRSVGNRDQPHQCAAGSKDCRLWNLRPQYILGNFEEWPPGEQQYDVVSCLNVLHHLYNPIHALQKLMAMARSKIVLEVAVPTWRDVGRDLINPLRVFGLGAPAIFLGIPRKRGDAAGRTFLFVPKALELLFNVHTSAFEPIIITRSPFKGRIVVEARKRQIGHLVVVAGPTSAGKSTFIDQLVNDATSRALYGLSADPWTVVQASEVSELPSRRHEQLILHYDFLRPSRTGIRSHDRDPVLHLMGVAERLTILTLIASRERLQQQLSQGEIERQGRKVRKRDLDLLKSYSKSNFLDDWYSGWLAFCTRYPQADSRLLVNNGAGLSQQSLTSWKRLLET